MSRPIDEYAALERQALVALAWQVLGDKKSSPELRAIAEERLQPRPKYNWHAVPLAERRVALQALRKARGEAITKLPGTDDPYYRAHVAREAQNVADDYRAHFDELAKDEPSVHGRCAACGRLNPPAYRHGLPPRGKHATATR